MALYMDLHRIEPGGVTAQELTDAHQSDLETQEKYGVRYLTYWFNEAAGQIFCLVDAPSVNAAVAVHREAHGLVADEIIEVEAGQMAGFMGNGTELPSVPGPTEVPGPERDRATRTILFTDLEGSVSMTQRLGDAGAMELLRVHDGIIRQALQTHGGNEVKHTGDGIMASFLSASGAVDCAITIQSAIAVHNEETPDEDLRVRIGLNAGEPVTNGGDLFGAAVQLAARICDRADAHQILVGGVIRELCIGNTFEFRDSGTAELKGFETPVQLFEVPWQ
ncbi:MAG: nickel-binding protein [Dehalococcoidia bacterium]